MKVRWRVILRSLRVKGGHGAAGYRCHRAFPQGQHIVKVLFSSSDVHPRDRFARWHEVTSAAIIRFRAAPEDAPNFQARLSKVDMGDIGLFDVKCAPMYIERGDDLIAATEHDDLLLCLLDKGAVRLEGTIALRLAEGNAVLLDPLQSYAGNLESECHLILARLPRREFEARMGSAWLLTLRALDAANPDFQFAIRLIRSFMDQPLVSTGGTNVVRSAVLDLLAIAFSDQLGRTGPVSNKRERLLLSMRSAVLRSLSDPHISISDIAQSAGISVRYANLLLREQGLTMGKLILSMRLDRCAAALSDTRQSHRSIQEIALAWGFSDQSNFGKRFKEATGLSPRDYRLAARRQQVDQPD
jgi:AraC family transcriptional activator of tynA and feaB